MMPLTRDIAHHSIRPVATGGHSGTVPPKFFLCPPKWFKLEKLIIQMLF